MTAPLPVPAQAHRRRRLAVFGVALLASLGIVLQTGWVIVQDRAQTLEAEATNARVAVRLLEEHANQTFQDAVHTLERVARAVHAGARSSETEAIRTIVARHDIGQTRHLKSVQYVSPQGMSWISSPDFPTHATEALDRPHIQTLLANPYRRGVIIGHPYASAYDSQWVIPVARTLYNLQDLPVGVVSVDIRLNYFGSLYARVAKENKASVTLLSDAGFILARSPFEARYVDRDVTQDPGLELLRSSDVEGTLLHEGLLEDEEGMRLYAYRHLGGFPVTTVLARELAEVLAPWQKRTLERGLLALVMLLLLGAFTYFLHLYLQRLHTARQSLAQSEAKFMTLFRHSPISNTLVRWDDGRFVDANDYWLHQFGLTLDEVVGRTAMELGIWVFPEQRSAMMAILEQHGSVDRFEVSHRTRHGQVVTGLMSGRVLQVGAERLIHFAIVDITRLRQIEQEIRDVNLALEQRVQARTRNLEATNRELNQALASLRAMQTEMVRSEKLAALGSLVAGVAHELNTPIGNCVTVGSTLQHQVQELRRDFDAGALRKSVLHVYLDNAEHGTDILMRALTRAGELVGSFKRVAVDQSSDQRRPFDLQTTLREICLTLEPMYKATPYRLQQDVAAGIGMDSFPGAIGQLITNFVSNALQHGFDGRAQGSMRLWAQALDTEQVVIEFSDDGVGMAEEVRRRVFDPFFTTKLGQGGSGLGMNIVYNIVHEILGGHIDIHSTLGAGTRIRVTLARVAPQRTAADAPAPAATMGAARPPQPVA